YSATCGFGTNAQSDTEAMMANADFLSDPSGSQSWHALDYAASKDTCTTLRRWTQIVGKIRMVQSPWVNHA
ncbi:MAG: DUF5996 family protein, partial [Burkholderiaceae bacterium]